MRTYPPSQVLSATPEQVDAGVRARYDSIQSLSASVDVTASTGGAAAGKEVVYTTVSGYLLLRKPGDLRLILFVPVAHIRAIDMVTNGSSFTVLIPPRNRAISGSNQVGEPSKNPLENLRPAIFFDSLLLRGAQNGELRSVTSDARIYQPDPKKKLIIEEPDYDLGIYRRADGDTDLHTLRVIHIGREHLMPYQQDQYDAQGRLVTTSTYANYQQFGGVDFPTDITMVRPLDQLKVVLHITKMQMNLKLEDDQFQLKIPEGTTVQHLP